MRLLFIAILSIIYSTGWSQVIRVGAKHFNEGYILGEIIAQLIESEGYNVERKFNLGGTAVCYEALRNNAIDIYPEYTGSLSEEILKSKDNLTHEQLGEKLQRELNLEISPSFGFNNTYGFALRKDFAESNGLDKISDLQKLPELSAALSYEFLKRRDGWDNLKIAYKLQFAPVGIEHGLAYQALVNKKIDLTDVYSTDGEIKKYDLALLHDDRQFFPDYQAVAVYQSELTPKIKQLVAKLAGTISEEEMQEMNAMAVFDNRSFRDIANSFLLEKNLITESRSKKEATMWSELLDKTIEHLMLTAVALVLAVLAAVPLGIILYLFSSISRPVMYFVGLLQTIPSIALLALMIPILGIGKVPAVTALFIYALLPILRNTVTGLSSVDPVLKKVALGMGMSSWQKLRLVEVPLAMPSILAGIRTAAVITIGTATLAAFIGAGGLGEFIVTGLALNNTQLILQGAIPAAILAIVVEFGFELIEAALLPKHLRKKL